MSLEEQKVIDEVAISTHYRKNVAEEQSDEASGENYL